MSEVLSFPPPAATGRRGWTQQELAEFYRVEAALIRAGLPIDSEQGLSDEAEPWFVFCRPDGAPIMHFARIGGRYVVASDVLDGPLWGDDFRGLINQIALRHPELLPIRQGTDGTRVTVHPAALLAALVAAAAVILSSEDAEASEVGSAAAGLPPAGAREQASPARPEGSAGSAEGEERDSHRKQLEALVVSAMIFAAFAAEEAESKPGLEALADPHAKFAARQDAPVDAGPSASADGAGHRPGLGAQHAPGSPGAVPAGSGSGSTTQQGPPAGTRSMSTEVASDSPDRAMLAQGGPLVAEQGHSTLRSGEPGPARAAGTAATAETSAEHSVPTSNAASAGDAGGTPHPGADDAAMQSHPRSVGNAVHDAGSIVPVRIERVLHRDADKDVIETSEAGRGAAKGVGEAKKSGDLHPERGPPERPGASADRSESDRRDNDGGLDPGSDRRDDHGSAAEARGHQPRASADAPGSQPDAASNQGRDDSRPAAAKEKSDPGDHGGGQSGASAETGSASHAETPSSDAHPAQGAGPPGKGAGEANETAARGADGADVNEHGAAKADAAAAAHAGGRPDVAGHSPGSVSGDTGGDAPGQHHGTGKLDQTEHGQARSGASDESASASHAHGGAAHMRDAPGGESQGRGAHGANQTTDTGTDAAGTDAPDGSSPGAAGKSAAASHRDAEPSDVNRPMVSEAPEADARHGHAADGAGPQRDPTAAHAPAASHPAAPEAGNRPAQAQNADAAAGHGQGKALAASVDAHGNIVFTSDPGHHAAPAASHAHEDATTEIGLVGLADHPGQMHHLDGHL